MPLNFFADCKTKEEARKLFLTLCLRLHPDKGGEHSRFIRMMDEYKYVQHKLPNEADRKTTQAEEIQLSTMIEKLCKLKGLDLELCGCWLWITGETYNNKEKLKDYGFKYSKKKKSWYYFNGIEKNVKRRGRRSLEEIRNKFGSVKIDVAKANQELKII
jgi:hypothetical protein